MVDRSEKAQARLEELERELAAERVQSRLAVEALLELRQSEARKGAILEAALDCIVSVDHEGRITEWNPAAERTFGHARAEAIGKGLVDLLVPPSLRERHIAGFRRYLESGQGTILGKRIEITALRAGGEEFPVELAVVATRSPGPPTFTAYIRDLTERKRAEQALQASEIAAQQAELALKRAEERLRHSQKMEAIGGLAGGIAHDFNNLLSVIMGYSTMLAQSLRADDVARGELEQITRASQRAANLTRQLLAFSRQQVLRPRSIDLNETLGALRDMLGRLIGEDIEIVFLLGAQSPVHVDPGQMEQVLMNLVLNSRDAMPNGGTLTIETRDVELDAESAPAPLDVPAGAYVMLAVSDTGVGMDAATLGRVFEPFFTTKEAGKGTGLGLSTVFGIVKQSGGSLWHVRKRMGDRLLGASPSSRAGLPRARGR